MLTASLAPFERAASCFDCAIVAARDTIIAARHDCEGDPRRDLVQIAGMLRLLKSEARDIICLLATSDLAEHRAMADRCRARMADAINLQRAASRCIKQGVVPPLPASYAGVAVSKIEPEWVEPWAFGGVWLMAWTVAWGMAWGSARE
jgi:hypothetical protein